jgi:tetratricopeptide (TPR) repeat protein
LCCEIPYPSKGESPAFLFCRGLLGYIPPKKGSPMKKLILFIIIIAATVILSYRYSDRVYTFYVRSYYQDFRGFNEKTMLEKARVLLKKGDYAQLRSFGGIIHRIYPESSEGAVLYGMGELRAGDKEKGLSLIISSLKSKKISPELFRRSITILYDEKYYGDVINLLKGRGDRSAEFTYYYGVSLYHTAKYAGAFDAIRQAIDGGMAGYESYRYCSRAAAKAGKSREALIYLKKAWDLNDKDPELTAELVDLYRKTGQVQEAEKLIRRMKVR